MTRPWDAWNAPAAGRRDAVLSPCGLYRYVLWQRLGPMWPAPCRWLTWVMLNPSTADAKKDDPTIRKVRGFTERLGYDGFIVVNRYAWRATDPRELHRVQPGPHDVELGAPMCANRYIHAAAEGPDNHAWVKLAVDSAEMVVCAWGARGGAYPHEFLQLLPRPLHVLRLSEASRTPTHPLYLPHDLTPMEWRP